jgi:hypothetical protein
MGDTLRQTMGRAYLASGAFNVATRPFPAFPRSLFWGVWIEPRRYPTVTPMTGGGPAPFQEKGSARPD